MNASSLAVIVLTILSLGLAHPPHKFKFKPPVTRPAHDFSGHVVVANRGSGTVSIINPSTLAVVKTVTIPGSEPMYFALSPQKSEIWVGDRAANRLQILKLARSSITPDGSVDTTEGLFHSIITQDAREAYPIAFNSCDIANNTVVYDLTTRRRLAIIPRPERIASLGGVPHDVTVNRKYGFVTYFKNSDGSGYVASYDLRTFKQIAIRRTLEDPHIAIRGDSLLTVAAQGGKVLLLSIPDLKVLARDSEQPSPHGMIITADVRYLYVTNIADGGDNAIVTYDVSTLARLPCPPVKTSNVSPHNPATSLDGSRIFVTHSGATLDKVSVFDIGRNGCPIPSSERIVTTGLNPFGVLVLPPAAGEAVCRVRKLRYAKFH